MTVATGGVTFSSSLDLSPYGQRFVIVAPPIATASVSLTVAVNCIDKLKP